jgi:hypothetical protein
MGQLRIGCVIAAPAWSHRGAAAAWPSPVALELALPQPLQVKKIQLHINQIWLFQPHQV